jgi:peptidoglycan L-alanyl-D-glutamate endopeptidase CwlK
MMGPVSEKRLELVHPTLAMLIRMLAEDLSEPIGVTQGLRNSSEQDALYAQGRYSLDVVNQRRRLVGWAPIEADENIRTVTEAKPGYSYHEFGLAVDVVPFESSGEPDWNENHPIWREIIENGESLGLTSGVSWRDEPHFQLTGRFPETPTDEVRRLAQTGGIQAVWNAAGIQS